MPMFSGLTMPQTDEGRLQQIADYLGRWRDYVYTDQPILPGSSLARDDEVFDVLPASALAWHGISSAVDHLDMFMAAILAQRSHPLAPQTLARTGMISGAHALWVLDGGDRVTRQKRALQLAYQEFAEDHKAVTGIAPLMGTDPATGDSNAKTYLDSRKEWMDRAVTVGASLGMTAHQVTTLGETDLLDKVTKEIVRRDPQHTEMAKSVQILWRMWSGVAHGLRWPVMSRTDFGAAAPADATGTVRALATNDISNLTMAASGVAIFLVRAIGIFEERRKPVGP